MSSSGEVHVTTWNSTVVEAGAEVAHEPVARTDRLCADERLKSTHWLCPVNEMLMITPDPLLTELASDVRDLRQDGPERWRVDRCFICRCPVGVTAVLVTFKCAASGDGLQHRPAGAVRPSR